MDTVDRTRLQPPPGSGDPIEPFLARQGFMVLDGGLATELERRGCDLDDPLWSARMLLEDPAVIRQVHLDFLEAGADCITSASYQATLEGLARRGLSRGEGADLLRLSVRLAIEARDRFWSDPANRAGRLRPIVAASIGPYGAFLADGSEYRGRYDLDEDGLEAFHAERFRILAAGGADLLACETLPTAAEGRVLLRLLRGTPGRFAWFSFSCRDGSHLSDGGDLAGALRPFTGIEQVVAVGVNCTAPQWIADLIHVARSVTDRPVVVYPNSGEGYDAARKEWRGKGGAIDLTQACADWAAQGAALLGGCCRTGPEEIRRMRRRLLRRDETI